MKTLTSIIKNRRAVYPRQYNGEPLAEKDILQILEVANWAPTHKRTEPWRFKVIQGEKLTECGHFLAERYKETTTKFSERKYQKLIDKFERSGCVIAICVQRDLKERIPEWEEIAATAMAVQNMWLMASNLGIGSYWSSTSLRQEIGGFLKLNEGEFCLGFFYLGHLDTPWPDGLREPLDNKIEWIG